MKAPRAVAISMTMCCLFAASLAGCVELRPDPPPLAVKRVQVHMGTLVTITAVASDKDAANRAIQAGFDEIKRLERLLSTWRSNSELSHVNAEAGLQPERVSRETLELVVRSMEMAQLTDGGFNIAVGPAMEAWSFTERQRIPSDEELQQLKPLVDWTNIQINNEAQTIF